MIGFTLSIDCEDNDGPRLVHSKEWKEQLRRGNIRSYRSNIALYYISIIDCQIQ